MSSLCCAICLASADPRGGEPLIAPGCCGIWYHKKCVNELIAAGHNTCPGCRAPFKSLSNNHNIQMPTIRSTFLQRLNPFSSRRSTSQVTQVDREDPLLTEEISISTTNSLTDEIPIVLSFECEKNEISARSVDRFYAKLNIEFKNTAQLEKNNALDLVCVLDVSGSMGGQKLCDLKKAMDFVIGCLNEKDRLSVLAFESSCRVVHNLLRMTEANKSKSKELIHSLNAGGGTDITDALEKGRDLLRNRLQVNQSTSFFLLTDGQDSSDLDQKLQFVREIKLSGASLLTFGFGSDHDSKLMTTIAEAAEGSFCYIETPDTVIDAFGGAIGAQKGGNITDLRVNVSVTSPGVTILNTNSGLYRNTTNYVSGIQNVDISFANIFCGEKRDILFELTLAESSEGTQQLLSASSSYKLGPLSQSSAPAFCVVFRLSDDKLNKSLERNPEVDALINRTIVSEATKRALDIADGGDIEKAKKDLIGILETVKYSVSAKVGIASVLRLIQDLEEAINMLTNRASYQSGGRALISENYSNTSAQRSVYSKANKISANQTASSMAYQGCARMSKMG